MYKIAVLKLVYLFIAVSIVNYTLAIPIGKSLIKGISPRYYYGLVGAHQEASIDEGLTNAPEVGVINDNRMLNRHHNNGIREIRSSDGSKKGCKCEEKIETTTQGSMTTSTTDQSSITTKKPSKPRTYRPPRVKSPLPIDDEAADWVDSGIKPKTKKPVAL